MLSKATSSTIFKSLLWLDLELNPGLPDSWRTLYSLGQCPDIYIYIYNLNHYSSMTSKKCRALLEMYGRTLSKTCHVRWMMWTDSERVSCYQHDLMMIMTLLMIIIIFFTGHFSTLYNTNILFRIYCLSYAYLFIIL